MDNPPPAPVPSLPTPGQPPKKDDAYAQALLHASNAEFSAEQEHLPKQKHVVSMKWLIYIAISLVLTILMGVIYSHYSKGKTDSSQSNSTSQDIKAVTNFNNPQAY